MCIHNKGHLPTKLYAIIKIRKLTLIQYYYLIYRLDSDFTKYPHNVFMTKKIIDHALHPGVFSFILKELLSLSLATCLYYWSLAKYN